MSPRSVLHRVLVRRLDAFEKHLRPALEGDVTAVHQARVASRRLRELLPLLLSEAGGPSAAEGARVSRAVRAVTRLLGPVRELDVTLGLLDELDHAEPALAVAISEVRTLVAAEHEARRQRLQRELSRREAARLVSRLRALSEGEPPTPMHWRERLAERTRRRAVGLHDAVDDAGMLYDPERLHAVRIAAKKLRYALELAGETRAAGTAALVTRLKALQDELGHLHDLQIVAGFVTQVPPAAGHRAALEGLAVVLDTQCRGLHAGFLDERGELGALAGRVRERVVPRVARE